MQPQLTTVRNALDTVTFAEWRDYWGCEGVIMPHPMDVDELVWVDKDTIGEGETIDDAWKAQAEKWAIDYAEKALIVSVSAEHIGTSVESPLYMTITVYPVRDCD